MVFLDTVQEVARDLTQVKGEQCIVLRTKGETKLVLTNNVRNGYRFNFFDLCSPGRQMMSSPLRKLFYALACLE